MRQSFDAQLQNFASQSAPGEDYTAYGAELAMQESAAALQKLLRQSGMKAYEISEELGYSSADYFTKVFKEITGVSPAQYKQSL